MDDVMTQEHKSKLVLVAGAVAAVCLVTSLLLLLAKLARARRRRARRSQLDLDTVASELELSGAELQLGDPPASASCQTLLDGQTASKTEFKPKGILKNSKTSENFR